MPEKKHNIKIQKQFTFIGIGLGFLFPIMALGLDFFIKELDFDLIGVIKLHQLNPLHFILDSAPVIMGFVFNYLGRVVIQREEKLLEVNNSRSKRLEILTSFITRINEGNLDIDLKDEDEEISSLLISLRDNLLKDKEDEKIRNWSNSGLASFGDVLRNNSNIDTLSNDIIQNLAKYLKVNQGFLFILNDDNEEDIFLELRAAYAFDRKKYLEKKIYPGQGLVGQCYKEKEILQLTEVPKDYIHITSGLGTEIPSYLVIIPLQNEDEIVGIIELAGFRVLKDFELEFLKKLAVSIASILNSTKVNDKTQRLLESTQEQAEQLRTQEEEMRQNMEELAATQEEMHRKEQEYIKQLEDYKVQLEK